MSEATLTSKGQITIPVEVRRKLGLQPGDRVDFVIERSREVVLRPKKAPLTSLLGIMRRNADNAATVEEMRESVASRAVEDWDRIRTEKD
jgi:AbrB family looped-hinge helix DNA binding protein